MNLFHRASAVLAISLLGCSDPPTTALLDAAPDVAVDATEDSTTDVPTDSATDSTTDVPTDSATDSATDVPIVPVPFSQVQELFTRTCAMPACHGRGANGGGGSGGLFLTDAMTSYGAMVNHPSDQVGRLRLVAPGDPDNSYLMIKVEGTMRQLADCATSPGRNPCGVQMPQLAAPLTTAERALIRNWIRAGAPMM